MQSKKNSLFKKSLENERKTKWNLSLSYSLTLLMALVFNYIIDLESISKV